MSTDRASSLSRWNQDPPPTDGPNSRRLGLSRGAEPALFSPDDLVSSRPLSKSLRRVEEDSERKAYPSPSESATPDLARDSELAGTELRMSLAEWREWEGVNKLAGGAAGDVGLGIGDIERWSSEVREAPAVYEHSLGITSNASQNYSYPSQHFYPPPPPLPHHFDYDSSPPPLLPHHSIQPIRPTSSYSAANDRSQLSPYGAPFPVTPRKRDASSASMIDHGSPGESSLSLREQELLSPVPMSKEEWLRLGGFEEFKPDLAQFHSVGTRRVGGQKSGFGTVAPPPNYSFPAPPRMESPRPLIHTPSALLPRVKPPPIPQWKVQPTAAKSSVRKSARSTGLSVGPIPTTPSKSRPTPYPTSSQTAAESFPFSTYVLNPSPHLPPLPDRARSHTRKKSAGHIPRPRNAFILFRSHAVNSKLVPEKLSEDDHRSVSRIVGEIWRGLPKDERREWEQLAEEEKRQHKEKWPDYKYKPKKRKSRLDEEEEEDEEMLAPKAKSPAKKKAAAKVSTPKVKEMNLEDELARERERCRTGVQTGADSATIDARLIASGRNAEGDYLVDAPEPKSSKVSGLPPPPERFDPSPRRPHRSAAADSPPSTPFRHSRLARRSPHSSSSSPTSNLRYSLPPDTSPYPLQQSGARIYGPPVAQPNFPPVYNSELQQSQAHAMQQPPLLIRNPFDPPAPYSTIYSNENEADAIEKSPFNPGFEFDNAPLLAPAYGPDRRRISVGGRWEQQRGVSRTMTRRELLAQEEEVGGESMEEVRKRAKGKRIASFALDKESFLSEAGLEATGSYDWTTDLAPTAFAPSLPAMTNSSFLSLTAPIASKYDKEDFFTPNLNEQHPPRLFHFGSTDLFAPPPTASPQALFPTANARPQRNKSVAQNIMDEEEGGEGSTLDVGSGGEEDDEGESVYSDFNLSVVGEHSFED